MKQLLNVGLPSVKILLFLIFFLSSCEKNIEIQLRKSDPRLVIEAKLYGQTKSFDNNGKEESLIEDFTRGKIQKEFEDILVVRVSKSTTLSATNSLLENRNNNISIPPIKDAQITLIWKDHTGIEKNASVFFTDFYERYVLERFTPTDKTAYTLKIDYDGKTYLASSTYYSPLPITSAKIDVSTSNFFSNVESSPDQKTGNLILKFDDNLDETNYYLINQYPKNYILDHQNFSPASVLSAPFVVAPFVIAPFVVLSDLQREKEIVHRATREEYFTFEMPYYAELIEIDKKLFQYLSDLRSIKSSRGGGPNASLSAPGNPQSFWLDENGQPTDALGYFIARGATRYALKIE